MVVLGVAAAAAAQTTTIAGSVVDPQGGAVVGASVTLTSANGTRAAGGRTDAEGTFSFAAAPGTYTLLVDSPGFVAWSQPVVVAAEAARVRVTLQIAGVLEDVQVSGTAPYSLTKPIPTASRLGLAPLDTPASVSVVSGDLIRNLGTTTLIVAKSLAPGITSSAPMGNGGNVLTARGFTGANSVKQLYNGMEIYNAGNVVAFSFDPWNVDFVGVLSGPASVLYRTGAIGGAVNMVPRRPDPLRLRNEVQFGVGRFGTYHEAIAREEVAPPSQPGAPAVPGRRRQYSPRAASLGAPRPLTPSAPAMCCRVCASVGAIPISNAASASG